ncbi:MAG: molybdenum cofactor guanylyltransferase MobA [Pikeienuella sp.]
MKPEPGAARPHGVILAGGRAVRMGGADKALRMLAGRPLLARVVERLAPQTAALAISANGDPSRFAGFALPVIADEEPGFPGPLAGVLAGMDWAAAAGASHLLTVAVDTPFFPPDLGARLAAAGPAPVVLAATPGDGDGPILHPTFGLWSVALREDLRAALADGRRRVRLWAKERGAAEAIFPDAPFDPFFNVNTPDDIARAERIAAERGF